MTNDEYVKKQNLCPVCWHPRHDGRLEALSIYLYVCDGKGRQMVGQEEYSKVVTESLEAAKEANKK